MCKVVPSMHNVLFVIWSKFIKIVLFINYNSNLMVTIIFTDVKRKKQNTAKNNHSIFFEWTIEYI